jgi:hypothetical protein
MREKNHINICCSEIWVEMIFWWPTFKIMCNTPIFYQLDVKLKTRWAIKGSWEHLVFIVQIHCNWLQWSNIKVYKEILFIFFFLHIYILNRNYTVKKSSIYTETYIFDTYIFGTDYKMLWSVNPLSFLFI